MTNPVDSSTICVVIPAYNEADTIAVCLQDLRRALPQATLLVIDNASGDGTAALAMAAGASAVLFEARPGKGFAVSCGMQWVLTQQPQRFQWIALHDADNEYAADDLALLLASSNAREQEGHTRIMGVGLRDVSLGLVLWRSVLANWVARCALQLALKRYAPRDILTGSRVFNVACARTLFEAGPVRGFELETALTRRALMFNVCIVSSPVRYTPRSVAQKKISAFDIFPILRAAWGI